MRYIRLTTTTGAQEPASIADLRDYGRIVSQAEDRVVEQLLLAARQEVERYSGHVLVPGTFRVVLDEWGALLELPLTPVRAVTSVTYRYDSGLSDVLDASAYYVDLTATPARVGFGVYTVAPWLLRSTANLEIVVDAGYATRADVPEDIRQHVMTLALLMYEHRDDTETLSRVRRYAADGASAFAVVTL